MNAALAKPAHYLTFEKPLAEIESRIAELQATASAAPGLSVDEEVHSLREKAHGLLVDLYAKLDPWQKTLVARHPERPHFKDYLGLLFTDIVELSGDRQFGDDNAILGGTARFRGAPCVFLGQEKGRTTEERLKHNFGMPMPEGYRKAVRLMDLAEQFGLPVIAFVDTAGAYPGIEAEERGPAEAIARSTERCLTLKTPMVSVIIGEGGSGGAVALAAGNKVLMMEHSIYSVISPEGCAAILWRDPARAKDAAEAMRIVSADLLQLKVIDSIIPEPVGGAHRAPGKAADFVGKAIAEALAELRDLSPEALKRQRRERFYAIGSVGL